MRRQYLLSFLIIAAWNVGASEVASSRPANIEILKEPSSSVVVTKMSSEVVPDGTTRVTLTVQAADSNPEKGAVLISTFTKDGECKKKIAIIRKMSVERKPEDWVVRLVRDSDDVTVITTINADQLASIAPSLEPKTREVVGRLLNKDMKKMSGQCRLECHQFDWDCQLACIGAGYNAGCVCCRPVGGGGSGPCDYMECFCGPNTSFCTPCPQ